MNKQFPAKLFNVNYTPDYSEEVNLELDCYIRNLASKTQQNPYRYLDFSPKRKIWRANWLAEHNFDWKSLAILLACNSLFAAITIALFYFSNN